MVDLSKYIQEGARLELEAMERLAEECSFCSSMSAQHSAQAMRIDELQAEIGRLRLDAATWWKKVSDLEAENAALRADAERYRWLRSTPRSNAVEDGDWWWTVSRARGGTGYVLRENELDAAIDAARGK